VIRVVHVQHVLLVCLCCLIFSMLKISMYCYGCMLFVALYFFFQVRLRLCTFEVLCVANLLNICSHLWLHALHLSTLPWFCTLLSLCFIVIVAFFESLLCTAKGCSCFPHQLVFCGCWWSCWKVFFACVVYVVRFVKTCSVVKAFMSYFNLDATVLMYWHSALSRP